MNRRDFLSTAAVLSSGCLLPAADPTKRKRVAAINSVYYKLSHAYHIAGRFLYGYTLKGKHHQPAFDVARMYNHQYHAGGKMEDLSRKLSRTKGVQLVDNI